MSFPVPVSLSLLNGFELRRDRAPVHVPFPAQRLIAFLALHHRPLHRRVVASALWVDSDEQQAAARLRSTLWRLPAPDGLPLVDSSAGRLSLAAGIDVDIRVAEDDDRVAELGVPQLCGEVLSDWGDDWVTVERERFRQLRLHRLEQLSERAQHQGRYTVAMEAALAAVAIEPLRESAHRRLMLVHLAEHNPSEALRQYERVRCLLRDELGLSPTAATRAVVANYLGRPLDASLAS
jgi:DNA-binding SARP family transcriptional activator